MKKTIALFSGGKDSFYSVQKALKEGNLDLLVSISSVSGDTQLHAGPEATRKVRREQLEGIGLPCREIEVGAKREYLHQLFKGLQDIVQTEDVGYIVTGDLWHPYTGGIGDMLAGALDVELIRPARKKCPSKDHSMMYMREVLDSGIKGIVVSVRDEYISREFVGRKIDYDFLNELKNKGIDVAGESGEYQSLVVSAPIMNRHIIVDDYDIELVDGKNGKEKFHRMKINEFHTER